MTGLETDRPSVVIERDLSHPPSRVWRALTRPELIGEWLMRTDDFRAEPGARFGFTADWGSIACEVIAIEPERTLSYSWVAGGLDSVVTWTLTPSGSGTRLRMEQTGFPPGESRYLHGARAGWPRFIDGLERVLATLD